MTKRTALANLFPSIALLVSTAGSASSQCLEWKDGFGLPEGFDGGVAALAEFDDGNGPALYAAGFFTSAGSVAVSNVAKWDGTQWSPLAAGLDGGARAFAVFDDGRGPALYVGGSFTHAGGVPASGIARWDGTTWSALGSGLGTPWVAALAVFDDGQGADLYVVGSFSSAGGTPVGNVARWNGSSWSAVGTELASGGGGSIQLRDLVVYDAGSGPELFAAYDQTFFGPPPAWASFVARWTGSAWTPVGTFGPGFTADLNALAVFDDGSGPGLYAGGNFSTVSGTPVQGIARWNGTPGSWSAVAPGSVNAPGAVTRLAAFDDGSGPALYAARYSAASSLVRWDGSAWTVPGVGVTDGTAGALGVFDDGSGPVLAVGGAFETTLGATVIGVRTWKAPTWSAIVGAGGQGLPGHVQVLQAWDDGSGPALFVAGSFATAGSSAASRMAKWDGVGWAALGSGLDDEPYEMAVHDDGSGEALYVGGKFHEAGGVATVGLARWDGNAWSSIGSAQGGSLPRVLAFASFDDGQGPALFVGGDFTSIGGVSASCVARWDGATWSPLGSGTNLLVAALAVYDDGQGAALYAAGSFTSAGGAPAQRIARWDGASWSPLGSGASQSIGALAVFDAGSGPELYAGGSFTSIGGIAASRIARWNGSVWSDVGGGFDGSVAAFTVFDDGAGTALYAAGPFLQAGVVPANRIARWNGATWSPLGSGLEANTGVAMTVSALGVFDDAAPGGPDLFVGGNFTLAGGLASSRVARWRGCAGPGTSFCAGDANAAACPCGNDGAAGHGCENSAGTGGALLQVSGRTTPDSVVLHASGELPSALSIFLQGDASVTALAFGDGVRCTGGSLKRLYVVSASTGQASAPGPGDPSITQRSASLGDPIAAGTARFYQVYYRDPDPAFCAAPLGSTFNATNALRIDW